MLKDRFSLRTNARQAGTAGLVCMRYSGSDNQSRDSNLALSSPQLYLPCPGRCFLKHLKFRKELQLNNELVTIGFPMLNIEAGL